MYNLPPCPCIYLRLFALFCIILVYLACVCVCVCLLLCVWQYICVTHSHGHCPVLVAEQKFLSQPPLESHFHWYIPRQYIKALLVFNPKGFSLLESTGALPVLLGRPDMLLHLETKGTLLLFLWISLVKRSNLQLNLFTSYEWFQLYDYVCFSFSTVFRWLL